MNQRLISRTHFRRGPTKSSGYQWYWTKESPNSEPVAVGGEGYDQRNGALNGFFAGEGFPDWSPGDPLPNGYVEQKFHDDHYVITQYETGQPDGRE